MNRGSFMGLNGREDFERAVPKGGVERDNLSTALAKALLLRRIGGKDDRFAIVEEIGGHRADAKTAAGIGRHAQTEKRFGEKRQVAQITREPAERVKGRRK